MPLAPTPSVQNRTAVYRELTIRRGAAARRLACDTAPTVLYSFLSDLLRLLIEILIVRGRGDAQLRGEALALRHQLGVLERQVRRPRWQPSDRLLLAAISQALPRPAWRPLLLRPDTLLRWHRELVRRKLAAYRQRPRRQRPVLHSELHGLIVNLAEQNPRCAWVTQPARNLAWKLQGGEPKFKFLPRDRDTKFSAAFDEVFRSEGLRVIRLPYRRPVANSFVERFVGTCRREVLDHLLILGRGHLERVLGEFIEHYNHARPYRGLDSAESASRPT